MAREGPISVKKDLITRPKLEATVKVENCNCSKGVFFLLDAFVVKQTHLETPNIRKYGKLVNSVSRIRFFSNIWKNEKIGTKIKLYRLLMKL